MILGKCIECQYEPAPDAMTCPKCGGKLVSKHYYEKYASGEWEV